jgi:hypothetical protein
LAPVTGARAARLVEFTGILQQALRDVSAWAEKGTAPARGTSYHVTDSQVTVPARARNLGSLPRHWGPRGENRLRNTGMTLKGRE